MDFGIETLENTVYQNEPYYVGAEKESLNLGLTGFLDREFDKHYDDMDSFMDAMKITDLEEREGILKSIGCDGDGNDRFDNAIDALAVMYKTIPGMRPDIDMIVKRINTVRVAKDPSNKYYIDIDKYGTERALEAKQKRSIRDQGIKQKSVEKLTLKK